jgi:rhodanese-related sulfurtransferase
MSYRPNTLTPTQVATLLRSGDTVLVDVREPDEFARRHVKGALSRPLSLLGDALADIPGGKTVVFTCRSGMRTASNCERLAASAPGESFILEGGVDAWAAARLPLEEDRKAPLELMRQVQIAAGLLILAGVLLGFVVHPAFFGLSAFVGAGLTLAGATGFCGMARLLALAPWNRRAAA